MNFYENILKSINNNVIIVDEKNNIIWNNNELAIELYNNDFKNKMIKYNKKYYDKRISQIEYNSKKLNIIEYIDISYYMNIIKNQEKDYLTKLYNREKMTKIFNDVKEKTKKNNDVYSLIIGDVDLFKKINDKYGHINGDKALKFISDLLINETIEYGFIGRIGGEEFLILLPSKTKEEAYVIIDKIRNKLSTTPLQLENDIVTLTMSFGISSSKGSKEFDELLDEADKALYMCKKSGRNKTYLYKKEH